MKLWLWPLIVLSLLVSWRAGDLFGQWGARRWLQSAPVTATTAAPTREIPPPSPMADSPAPEPPAQAVPSTPEPPAQAVPSTPEPPAQAVPSTPETPAQAVPSTPEPPAQAVPSPLFEPPTEVVEGTLGWLALGTDSFALDILGEGGKVTLHRFPNLDSLEVETRQWLQARLSAPLGRSWPSYTDVGSRVRAVRLSREPLLVDYQVMEPGPCWLLILGSYKQAEQAQRGAERARQAGYCPEVIESSQYPPLRPGYFVCLGGGDVDLASAQRHVDQARKNGFADAYSRQIHSGR